MQAEQQRERERFEAWFAKDFMDGMDDAGKWDDERGCYVEYYVHMAYCGWRAALSHPSTPQGWQPISSAPKDGRWLLLSGETYRSGAGMLVANYCGPDDWGSADDGYGAYIRPTHWMPLPTPPEQGGKG